MAGRLKPCPIGMAVEPLQAGIFKPCIKRFGPFGRRKRRRMQRRCGLSRLLCRRGAFLSRNMETSVSIKWPSASITRLIEAFRKGSGRWVSRFLPTSWPSVTISKRHGFAAFNSYARAWQTRRMHGGRYAFWQTRCPRVALCSASPRAHAVPMPSPPRFLSRMRTTCLTTGQSANVSRCVSAQQALM